MRNFKKVSFNSMSIRRKMIISFALMSIIPLLMLLNYLFPNSALQVANSVIIFLITLTLVIFGFLTIKHIFDSVSQISAEAKAIASGDYERRVTVTGQDEVGDLSNALNNLTDQIRRNMDELREYEIKTRKINIGIHKRMIVLSGLLQISASISKGAGLDEVMHSVVEYARQLANSSTCFILFRNEQGTLNIRAFNGGKQDILKDKSIKLSGVLSRAAASKESLIIDSRNKVPPKEYEDFKNNFGINNCLCIPIYSRGEILGFLCIGNDEKDFFYGEDDSELLGIFAKQIAIAVENERLSRRVTQLEIKDSLTGLFNERFIRSRLDEEIKRALIYQRPCGFILLEVDGFARLHKEFGELVVENILKKITSLFKDSVSNIDRVARFGDNQFAIVLPEKNKRKCQEVAEYIRKKVEFAFSEESDIRRRVTISGGISENPIDGTSADELIDKASKAVDRAKSEGGNRIAV